MRIYCPDFLFYSSADMCDVLRLETSPKYYFPPPCAIHNLKEKKTKPLEKTASTKNEEKTSTSTTAYHKRLTIFPILTLVKPRPTSATLLLSLASKFVTSSNFLIITKTTHARREEKKEKNFFGGRR